MMIEVVVTPSSGVCIPLRILNSYIGAVPMPGEIASSRRLGTRTICVLCGQRELQFLEQNRPFGEYIRLLVYLVRARLDVNVMKLRETGFAAIESVGSQGRSDIHPFVKVLRQDETARGGVLREIAPPGVEAIPGLRLCKGHRHDRAACNCQG